jgi:uncharacterized protein YkwD
MSQAALLTAMNARRATPLAADPRLNNAAQAHADDMASKGYFSHTSQDGRSPWDRAALVGYPGSNLSENIAWGQRDATECVADWMASRSISDRQASTWTNARGHAQNILNPVFKVAGCGVAKGKDGRMLWVAMFGAVSGGPVPPSPPPPPVKPITFWEWLRSLLNKR